MSRIAYEDWKPTPRSLSIVSIASRICAEYQAQGFDLTLRQLYYQFVARDYLPNNQRSYDNLGATIDRARKAGLLDWNYIVDRTRNLAGYRTFDTPADLIEESARQYHVDLWEDQDYRLEVWVEKEALAGVISRAALGWGLDYFSCRGYVSQSEIHAAAQRHRRYEMLGQDVVVVHLGDHDPSGIDMTRDIGDRLALFGASTQVNRIALNWDQIDQYAPPPNPAKLSDSRAAGYIAEHGSSSWELDALDPATLSSLIDDEVGRYIQDDLYEARIAEQKRGQDLLRKTSAGWDDIVKGLEP